MNIYSSTLTLMLIVCGMTDVIRKVSIGSLTLQGVWTIFVGLFTVALILTRQQVPRITMAAFGFALFLGLGFISWYINAATAGLAFQDQAQSLMVYAAFVGSIFLSAGEAYSKPISPPSYLTKGCLWATQIAMILYGMSLVIGGLGSSEIMSARPFAIFAIVMMAWLLANWRNQALSGAGFYAFGLVTMVALSFSRTATVICLILYPLSQISPKSGKSWIRMGLWVALISLFAYLSFTYITPIRDRFTASGDNAKVGNIQINTSGRTTMWEGATKSADESPLFGKGPGSVKIPVTLANRASNGHPHNDYLRLRHDFGWMGLGLWVGSSILILVQCTRYWIWAIAHDPVSQHVYHAPIMAMFAVGLMMVTDNVIIYPFAMVPLGILIGNALGLGQARQELMIRQVNLMTWMNALSEQEQSSHLLHECDEDPTIA
jgi:O-antigen ligase